MRRAWPWLLLLPLGLLAGCYNPGEDRTKAQVRLINASEGYAALDLRVDGQLRQGAVPYGGDASYAEVDPSKTVSTVNSTGSASTLLSFTPALARNQHYAVLAFGKANALRELVLDENEAAPNSGHATLHVVNAAPDGDALDVYVTDASEPLATAVATRAGAKYGEQSLALDVAPGNWRLRVTGANDANDLRLDVADLALASTQVATLVLTPSRGGAMVNALLVTQQGAITRLDGTHVRARALAGISGATVAATLGGVSILAPSAAALGAYVLAPSGAPALNITVDGNSAGAPATALAAGGDYTLLVYGSAATPVTAWVEDDNRFSTATGKLRIRLVNATTGVAGPLALAVDNFPTASSVAAGVASAYAEMNATTASTLVVTATGVANPLFSVADVVLEAGRNYSVLVFGTTGAATGIVRRDR